MSSGRAASSRYGRGNGEESELRLSSREQEVLVSELAHLYQDGLAARRLLEGRLHVPMGLLPGFAPGASPSDVWWGIIRTLGGGIIAAPLRKLLVGALTDYPRNDRLLKIARRHDVTVPVRPGSPWRPSADRPTNPSSRGWLAIGAAAMAVVVVTVLIFVVPWGGKANSGRSVGSLSPTSTAPAAFHAVGGPLTDAHSQVWWVAVSPDGGTLAAASENGTVQLWDMSHPAKPSVLPAVSTGDGTGAMTVAFAPGGQTLASGTRNGTVQLWNTSNTSSVTPRGAPLVEPGAASAWAVGFSPVGNLFVSGDHKGQLRMWNVSNPDEPRSLGAFDGQSGEVWSVAFAPDGSLLATGGQFGSVGLWDTSNPNKAPRLVGMLPVQPSNGTKAIESVSFAPDGRTVATASVDHTVRLWDVSNPSSPRLLIAISEANEMWAVAFAREGPTLAAAGGDGTILLWDVTTLNSPRPLGDPLSGHTSTVTKVAFLPDGNTLVSSSRDKTVRVWATG
ncbi:WD40 repeat domain-containing protein [Frankia sp. AgB1.9]|uniref:effector-associated domain EAD1-containing protein n=1 Tax=unclassified Frankia TaxID=2632575 RepID=UPI0019311EC3|nr:MULTISPECIES: effector-associated domain EAD1-containing protein [unclassified Frankia]MBL7491564.1 WD40 repeat domain-containing protein [Frankia sp. AgW1.1]MBL7547024.1 WD40 repeat domain-containing protein [Frankia sp. AgB1.9]MBL7617647.1 WD40 repeat domain-containing protein [Frankia sp. AgB1.8]